MKHCLKCCLEFGIENKCANCGEELEGGRLPGNDGLEKIKIEMSGERCGECGRGFRLRENFCGSCGKSREEAIKIEYRSYIPESRGPS